MMMVRYDSGGSECCVTLPWADSGQVLVKNGVCVCAGGSMPVLVHCTQTCDYGLRGRFTVPGHSHLSSQTLSHLSLPDSLSPVPPWHSHLSLLGTLTCPSRTLSHLSFLDTLSPVLPDTLSPVLPDTLSSVLLDTLSPVPPGYSHLSLPCTLSPVPPGHSHLSLPDGHSLTCPSRTLSHLSLLDSLTCPSHTLSPVPPWHSHLSLPDILTCLPGHSLTSPSRHSLTCPSRTLSHISFLCNSYLLW